MDPNTIAMLGILGTIIGCFVGLAGWLSGRDKKIANDSEWKGVVNTKLDIILGVKDTVDCISKEVSGHGERLGKVEESAKQAHLRITEINERRDKS